MKDLISIVHSIRNTCQDASKDGTDPVHKVMGVIGWVVERLADPKDTPGGGEHRIHGWTRGRKAFNQGSNGNSGQCLLDNVMVIAKMDFPVELCSRMKGRMLEYR